MIPSRFRAITFFESAFLLLIASFFLKLGSDILEGPGPRIFYLGFLGVGFLFLWLERGPAFPFRSRAFVLFLSLFVFETVRLLWALWQMRVMGREASAILHQYVSSPGWWLLYFGFFTLSFFLFKTRNRVNRLLWVLGFSGFILAFAALPPLLIKGHAGYFTGYFGEEERHVFFPPFVYSHEIVRQYLVSRYANPNYVGNVIAVGFFPALGLFFYSLQRLGTGIRFGKGSLTSAVSLGLPAILVGAEALAIVLFFSRATILCFAFTFLFFLGATLLKYPSRVHFIFAGAAFLLVAGFLIWAGNLRATWKEVQTVKEELVPTEKERSLDTTLEGAKRALRIYRAFPLGGVGTRGYSNVSESFATPGIEHYAMSKFKAFCHYLQILAEEGSGAFLYFLFLLAYFFESARKLLKTTSRFQFMAGLSLMMPVLMILIHAAVKPLMDYFVVAVMVYILMGATLASLRHDFEHS